MGFLEFCMILLIAYYILYLLLWILLDCNVELWLKTTFGVQIATMKGQVVWITGASSGIGRALAINLARHGVHLVLSARRENLLQDVFKECLNESNGLLAEKDILVLPMDLLQYDSHEKCLNQVIQHFGHLDILVNNAGRSQRANWEDIDIQVDRDLFELDVFSVMHLSRLVVKYFLKECDGHGYIAATSSVASFVTAPFSATYCGAKRALNAYLEALHVEHRGINITIFSPGPIATDFLEEAFTHKTADKCGQSTKNQKNRMTADRCGHLFAVSLANKLHFTWCGLFPVNLLAYCSRVPFLQKLMLTLLTKDRMMKIREGK